MSTTTTKIQCIIHEAWTNNFFFLFLIHEAFKEERLTETHRDTVTETDRHTETERSEVGGGGSTSDMGSLVLIWKYVTHRESSDDHNKPQDGWLTGLSTQGKKVHEPRPRICHTSPRTLECQRRWRGQLFLAQTHTDPNRPPDLVPL